MIQAAVLRTYKINEVPAGFLQDEVVAGYDAFSLLRTGKDHHGVSWPITFRTFNDWTGHSFNYQLMPFVWIFGLSKATLRYAVATYCVITAILIFFLSREISGSKRLSLLSAYLYSVSQYSFATSRWANPPHTVPFFMSLTLYAFFLAYRRGVHRKVFWVFPGIFGALTMYAYPAAEGFVPIWFIGVVAVTVYSKSDYRRNIISGALLMIAMAFFFSLPLLMDHIYNPQTLQIKMAMVSLGGRTGSSVVSFLKEFFLYLSPHSLFFPADRSPIRSVPGFGYENRGLLVFYYAGIFVLLFRRKWLESAFPGFASGKISVLTITLFLFPVVPSLLDPPGDYQRITYFIPISSVLSAIGIVYIYRSLTHITTHRIRYGIYGIVVVMFLFFISQQLFFYRKYFGKEYIAITQWNFQYGLSDALKYAVENSDRFGTVIMDQVINQPYIYVLYNTLDPANLTSEDYQNLRNYDFQSGWLSVEKLRNFRFQPISTNDVIEAKFIKGIFNSPISRYGIYQKNNILFIRYEHVNNPGYSNLPFLFNKL